MIQFNALKALATIGILVAASSPALAADSADPEAARLGLQETFVQSGDVKLHVVHGGKEQGPVVLFLHGWPDTWKLWRKQIPAFVAAGYRVVAPDLRGFGLSDKPAEVAQYKVNLMVDDVVRVMDALSIQKASLVGHDWGSLIAWFVAAKHAARTEKLVAMTVGHPAIPSRSQFLAEDMKRIWYYDFFQKVGVAEFMLSANDFHFFRDWLHNHSEADLWVQGLSQPGALTAALNWFRANAGDYFTPEYAGLGAVTVPTLAILSRGDLEFTRRDLLERSQELVQAPWKFEMIAAPSHWSQLDMPKTVNRLILRFLAQQR